MKKKKSITIHIANQPLIEMEVPQDEVDKVRKVETEVNRFWSKWCERFDKRTPTEVLAMVTFQYARYYYNLAENIRESEQAITDFEKSLDKILLNVK